MPDPNLTTNMNFLSPLGFRLVLKRTPNLEYFCQAATLPGLSLPEVTTHVTPFVNIPHHGTKITFEPLNLRFRVDEDMANYMEIYAWIIALGFPKNFVQYKTLADAGPVTSDGTLMIHTSNNNPAINFIFEDMFPINLTPLEFDVTAESVEYLEASLTLAYKSFTMSRI